MSDSGASAVEIFIGNPVEHESERSTLQVIERVLAAENCPAMVFVNFSVLSRQIDILVACDGLTLVIEAKTRTRAVRGGENGPWQVHVGSGDWKDFPNPYQQALRAALAIKDAMRACFDGPVPYVSAALARPFFVLLALFASWAAGAMVWSAKHASGRQDPLRVVSASGRGRVLV